MSSITVVTNRHLCREDFLVRIERLLAMGIDRLILREKDLSEDAYFRLAEQVVRLCETYSTQCVLHSQIRVEQKLSWTQIHLPISQLRMIGDDATWQTIGVSIHSVQEAQEAVDRQADYLVAGHIFETDCKKGLAGRGRKWLRSICTSVEVPVYAIGGITADNVAALCDTGIAGICVMSSAMQTENISRLLNRLRQNICPCGIIKNK